MRNKKGQFVKGERAHPETEFKPGEHWRQRKPFWDREWLHREYIERGRSAADIGAEFGCSGNNVLYFLKKFGIQTRTTAETRALKHWGLSGERNGMYGRRGAEVPNWKGGVTPERQALYSSEEWAVASAEVWRRDRGICQRCGKQRGKRAHHIHHIISFAVPEERSNVENLVLLCIQCHRWVHSKANIGGEFIGTERKEVAK
jgi:hypothetical protein